MGRECLQMNAGACGGWRCWLPRSRRAEWCELPMDSASQTQILGTRILTAESSLLYTCCVVNSPVLRTLFNIVY